PVAAVRHRRPGLLRRESIATLEELDRDVVGGSDEGHVAIARRAVDGHSAFLQAAAALVDIVDTVGEVAEIAAFAIAALVPIVGELDLGVLVAGGSEENEGEAALLAVVTAQLLEAEQLEEADRRLRVRHPDHGMEIFHRASLSPAIWLGTARGSRCLPIGDGEGDRRRRWRGDRERDSEVRALDGGGFCLVTPPPASLVPLPVWRRGGRSLRLRRCVGGQGGLRGFGGFRFGGGADGSG